MEQSAKLYVKGMVCNRCVRAVKETLQELGEVPIHVALGEITLTTPENTLDKEKLQDKLAAQGFILLEDRRIKIVKAVKALVAEVYSGDYDFPEGFRFSKLVKMQFSREYETVSNIFSCVEGKTLEQYIIEFRVNKVKELLVYSTAPLSDIAFKLNFSSVAHLSTQFKQQTGLTTSFFKEIRKQKAEVLFSNN